MEIPMMTKDAMALNEVAEILQRLRTMYGPFNSAHEAYGVIAEEVAEFFEEVRLRRSQRSPERMRAELPQIAAACCRAASDLAFIEPVETAEK